MIFYSRRVYHSQAYLGCRIGIDVFLWSGEGDVNGMGTFAMYMCAEGVSLLNHFSYI